MFRPPARLLRRQALQRQTPNLSSRHPSSFIRGARNIGTASKATGSSSWKSTLFRLGLAIGAVYYYNTSNVFAEEPVYRSTAPSHARNEVVEDDLETVRARSRQQRSAQSFDDEKPLKPAAEPEPSVSAQEIEEEAESEGAFNPETGEINWDCPCLGGMAHGPCGDEFKAAFSCFVYSKAEVKGVDCIENFKHMQDCFRRHPDVYGEELDEDDVEAGDVAVEGGQPDGIYAASRVSPGSPPAASPPSPMPPSANTNATETASAPAASPASEARSVPSSAASASHSHGHGATNVASTPATPSPEEKEAQPGRARTAEEKERKVEPESDSGELAPKAAPDAK